MDWMVARRTWMLLILAAVVPAMLQGDAEAAAPTQRLDGIVYYLDGAGGGGLLLNWGRRIEEGLEKGGFRGEFEDHNWQTGLGPLLDHAMSESFKRKSAEKLAREIAEYMDRRPGEPVHLIGLSAGTAILVYTLEALPPAKQVDTAVVLNSSVDAGYDLTRALRHVRGKMYVFASRHDPLLNTLVPMVGTADREFRIGDVAGLRGFRVPSNAGPETRSLYSRLANVPYRSDFARHGNFGTHTGATTPSFVAHVIAPLLKTSRPVQAAAPGPAKTPARPWPGGRTW